MRSASSPSSPLPRRFRATLSPHAGRGPFGDGRLFEHVEHRVQRLHRDVAHVPDAEGRLLPLAVAAAEGEAAPAAAAASGRRRQIGRAHVYTPLTGRTL